MSRPMHDAARNGQARLAVDYVATDAPLGLLRGDDVLAVFGFGHAAPAALDDPRYLRVPLEPHGAAPFEVWRANAPVMRGCDDGVRWASDGELMFGVIEVPEQDGDVQAAACIAYARMAAFTAGSRTPHLLRIWNYVDAITFGEGDDERYRAFCVGRARGLGDFDVRSLPAATAIGRCDGERVVQVYWLSSAAPGTPVENPRQMSAYRYPRQYGPQSPSFARAMLPPAGSAMPLLLSGTAAIVGHASMHHGELLAQLDETFHNFDALVGAARGHDLSLPPRFGAGTRLKVYVRDRDDLQPVADALQRRFGDAVPCLLLHAAICRRELAVEIDGVHGHPPG
ncbi:pteridine-dependent deoxygenase [Luteimonas sp. MC1895]|uniref:chorismate transformation enzyme, FkbO/Hyg5 family n=1 Tax=Luteimonas sp. MC1895 TaxID=2819513 RepID=UPI0018F06276|nr:pteridine-dependent deoxygenase [Luteimonas sp. MC1895]MBJ6979087.1 pteridine-dependent deoxygenase [Luteimonas sp. MC1895]